MKITGYNPFVKVDSYVQETNDRGREKVDKLSSEEAGKMDQVVLSPRAKEILAARKVLKSIPDIREDKVAEIKARVANGTYTVDGKKIARKMIQESLIDSLV